MYRKKFKEELIERLKKFNHIFIRKEHKRVFFICGVCGKNSKTNYNTIRKNCIHCFKRHCEKSNEDLIEVLSKNNHKFINIEKIDGRNKVLFKCGNCNKISSKGYRHIDSKYCNFCRSDSTKHTLEEYKEHFLKYGHKVIDLITIKGIQRANFICGKCGNKSCTQYSNVKNNCKNCSYFISKSEKLLLNLIKENYKNLNIEENNRTILKNCSIYNKDLELDIVIYDNDKIFCAIEWNGEYYHRERIINDEIKIKKMSELNIPFVIVNDKGSFNKNKVIKTFSSIQTIINDIKYNKKLLYKIEN